MDRTPRSLAHSLLQKAEKNDSFLNLSLDHALEHSALSAPDRALCTALVMGVTERRMTLDARLSTLSDRSIDSLDASVRAALRMGLYQLMYMDRIPPHAAVCETVDLVSKRVKGFVNAVLRAALRQTDYTLPDDLSVKHSVCPPLVEKFVAVYGTERADSILASFGKNPPLTLAVNTKKISRDGLLSHLKDASPTSYSPVGMTVRGSVRELYGFEDGLFYVQDEASQVAVAALDAKEGQVAMDICACPGSKTFGIALSMGDRGIVYAYDLHEKKLPLIEQGAARLGLSSIRVAACDGRTFLPTMEEKADRVLCDVPCSGFGVLAKKPELRYKDPAVSAALPAIQRAILDNACRYVAPGGILVYSTCTVFPEENEDNVLAFLGEHPEFTLEPFSVGALSVPTGYLTFLPDCHPTDGFFVAKLRKQG